MNGQRTVARTLVRKIIERLQPTAGSKSITQKINRAYSTVFRRFQFTKVKWPSPSKKRHPKLANKQTPPILTHSLSLYTQHGVAWHCVSELSLEVGLIILGVQI